jgi:hypothetical protein
MFAWQTVLLHILEAHILVAKQVSVSVAVYTLMLCQYPLRAPNGGLTQHESAKEKTLHPHKRVADTMHKWGPQSCAAQPSTCSSWYLAVSQAYGKQHLIEAVGLEPQPGSCLGVPQMASWVGPHAHERSCRHPRVLPPHTWIPLPTCHGAALAGGAAALWPCSQPWRA